MKNKPYILPADTVSRRKGIEKYKNRWNTAILLFRSQNSSENFVEFFKTMPTKHKILWGIEPQDKNRLYETKVSSKKILIVARCVFGAPQAAVFVEELHFLGVKNIIGCGVSGSINRNFKKGDFIYIDKAIVTDGTAKGYGYKDGESIKVSQRLQKCLLTIAAKHNIKFPPANAGTIDAVYNETSSLVKEFSRKAVHVINMEASSFYGVCKKNKINFLWLGYISDTLYGSTWDVWNWDENACLETCARVCSKIVANL